MEGVYSASKLLISPENPTRIRRRPHSASDPAIHHFDDPVAAREVEIVCDQQEAGSARHPDAWVSSSLTQVKVPSRHTSILPHAADAAAYIGSGDGHALHIGAVILLGVIFFLSNLDIAPAAELKALLTPWWPLLLIVVGMQAIMRPRRAS